MRLGGPTRYLVVGFCTASLAKEKIGLTNDDTVQLLLGQVAQVFGGKHGQSYVLLNAFVASN